MYPHAIRLFLLLLIGLSGGTPVKAQPIESSIKAAGIDMMRALMRKDYDSFSLYMHPKIIEMAGGRDKMIRKLDTASQVMVQFGAIRRITIGNPYKVVRYHNQWQATLPQTTVATFFSGTITLETTLIAISADEGKHWYFIDTNLYDMQEVKQQLPDLSPDLVIPPRKEPVIKADQ